jgi:hypothetical protein
MSVTLEVSTSMDEGGRIAPPSRQRPLWGPPTTVENALPSATISDGNASLSKSYDAAQFACEQIRGLIQRVFFPGWPKPSRQVVLSGADAQTSAVGVCSRIAREMASGLPGTVCAVDANGPSSGLAELLAGSHPEPAQREANGCIRAGKNLWLADPESLFGAESNGFSAVFLRTRLSELRRNFDYTLIHAPAAFLTQTIVLGQLADGLILVIEARKTHRAVAQTTLAILKAAKIAVLGTVLTNRTFPIPETLYKRL